MRDFVDGQRARLAEALAAVVALEGLLFGVDVAMVSQVILATEGLAANITAVGALVGVSPLVDQQVVGLGELTVAVFADELLLRTRSRRSGDFQWSQPGARCH